MRAHAPLILAASSLLCLTLAAQGGELPVASADPAPDTYALVQDVSTANFTRMVDFALLPGTDGRQALVVTQKDARVRRVSLTGAFAPVEFGNLSSFVENSGNEEGLLSLAASPNYSRTGGATPITRRSTACPASRAALASCAFRW